MTRVCLRAHGRGEKFDELTKGLDQLVTRRAALKKFGLSLADKSLQVGLAAVQPAKAASVQ